MISMKYFFLFLSIFLMACQDKSKAKADDPSKNKKPNVIMILTDDQGWGDLSMNGHRQLSTPHIDALAAGGVTFDRFYVSPVCSPTRAEILTGRYHVRGGVYSTSQGGERLDLDETTMAEVFRKGGYATAAYGKWHNGMQAGYHPNARGFDDFYGFCSGHWGNYFDPMLEHNGEIVKGDGFIIDDLTSHGIDFIKDNKDNPFFLYLPYCTPHSPMQVPDRWYEKYDGLELQQGGTYPDREKIEHTRAALAMCENIDWNVGRIMEQLKAMNLLENTIVMFLSDNGPNGHRWNGGMRGTKGSTDEGGIRSPLIMSWKGTLESGKVVDNICSNIDLLPTLCDLTGVDLQTNKPVDGRSIKPLLIEDSSEWDDGLVISHWKGNTSVRSQTHRLDQEGKLYDMVHDPNQTVDVAAEHPEVMNALTGAKEKWEQEVLVELPKEDKRTFDIGHPDYPNTQIPARDVTAHGNITRSNRWPNCSYFSNWTSITDKITCQTKVLAGGTFELDLYYTCPASSVGSIFTLNIGDEQIETTLTEAHDPPDMGMENDRFERGESYVKDFKKLSLGSIKLEAGEATLEIKANEIKGAELMDFRMLMLRRVEG